MKKMFLGVIMVRLQNFLDILERGRKIHISIWDVSGILNGENTLIDFKSAIHSKRYCDIAKSSDKGYRLCLFCKTVSNGRAISEKRAFCGHCPYGIFEACVPIIIDRITAAIVYVGNAITDIETTKERLGRTCRYTGIDQSELLEELKNCEHICDYNELLDIGNIVSDYVKMLCKSEIRKEKSEHWLVLAAKRHAEEEYSRNPTLMQLAAMYHKNEKYLGRLFLKEVGISFNQYALSIKLKKAEVLILETNAKIIDIAFDCGFNTVSYFNRAFKKEYKMSPSEYRNSVKQKNNLKA
jgi:AraC-like DNA-binding protein